MKTEAKFLLFAVGGCLLFLFAIFSPSLGIPEWIQDILLVVALILVIIGVRFASRLKKENTQASIPPRRLSQRQKIVYFVMMTAIALAITTTGPFWLPLTIPDISTIILWTVPFGCFPLIVALFWYVIFKKLP